MATRSCRCSKRPATARRISCGRFTTSRNEVCLHSDSRLLPKRPQARASWNYLPEPGPRRRRDAYVSHEPAAVAPGPEDYCVTLNANGSIDAAKVLRRMVYHHPLYDSGAIEAQTLLERYQWPEPHSFLRGLLVLRLPRRRAKLRSASGPGVGSGVLTAWNLPSTSAQSGTGV